MKLCFQAMLDRPRSIFWQEIVLTSERLSDSIAIRERTIRFDCLVKSWTEI
jgi:hypothetical protein